jgi:hypothetical protein
LFDVHWP